MNKTPVTVAIAPDHNFQGPNHCAQCEALFFATSRRKWEALKTKWQSVRERMNKPYEISPIMIAAVMTEENTNAKYKPS